MEPGNVSVLQWAIKTERIVKLHCKPLTTVETAGKTFQTQENSEFVRISLAKIPYIITLRKYSPFFRKSTNNQCSLLIKNGTKHHRQDSTHQDDREVRCFSDRDFAILVNVQF